MPSFFLRILYIIPYLPTLEGVFDTINYNNNDKRGINDNLNYNNRLKPSRPRRFHSPYPNVSIIYIIKIINLYKFNLLLLLHG